MITIQGEITEQTALDVAKQLAEIEGVVHLFIDSPGGDLFAGLEIYDMFSDRDMSIEVKRAGSVASIIALSGKDLPTVESGGGFAIHNAHVKNTEGNHNDLRRTADSLEKYSQIVARIYQSKTKLSNAQAVSLMNDSTTINANDALTLGFAKSIKTAEMVENKSNLISQIIKIDMTLLERVKNNLGLAPGALPPVTEPANAEEVVTLPTEEAAFTDEQIAQLTELVGTLVAEALANAPTQEEIGNTIAVVLNEVVSKGTPPKSAQITNAMSVEPTALEGFAARMEQIKKDNGQ